MRIRITDKALSLPPYISTAWENIQSLYTEQNPVTLEKVLIISIVDGSRVQIPNLPDDLLTAIFRMHSRYLEQENARQTQKNINPFANLFGGTEQSFGFPLRIGPGGLEALGTTMQHNPAQSNTPELPAELLDKVSAVAKVICNDDLSAFPKAENNCNCLHCQIARAVHRNSETETTPEEEVKDEELIFRLWDIASLGEKMYSVINPIDPSEHYNVYLGDPIGCTCGQKDCEHIKEVLRS